MSPTQPSPETFRQLCQQEVQFLDGTLADVEFLALRRSFTQAANRFGEFRRHFEQHVLNEERVLLPLYLERTGDPEGVAARIRQQHQELFLIIEAVAAAISHWEQAVFISQVTRLRAALQAHHVDEQALLYPSLLGVVQTAADWRRLCFEAEGRAAGS